MFDRFTEFDYGLSLLSSMFHQDWRNSGDSAAILDIFLWEGQAPPAALALHQDAVHLGGLPRVEIEDVWTASTSEYFVFGRDAVSGDAWLSSVQECCRRWFAERDIALVFDDSLPQAALGEQVATTIGSLSAAYEFDDKLIRALASLKRCADTLSAGLAFRLLLRILDSRRIGMDSQLYGELSSLGRDLDCGDFVVSSLEYLVIDADV